MRKLLALILATAIMMSTNCNVFANEEKKKYKFKKLMKYIKMRMKHANGRMKKIFWMIMEHMPFCYII